MASHIAQVIRFSMAGPGDVSGLQRLLDDGVLAAEDVVAILGKTEGNGGVNDFTREYAARGLAACLAARLAIDPASIEDRVALVMSGGTEGVLSPHATIFARKPAPGGTAKRLALGVARTRDFQPWDLGRAAQINATRDAVHAAMEDAGIDDPRDVHFVQVKCPLLTAARMRAARAAGIPAVTDDAYHSMAWSRGASALGVALALGEIAAAPDDAVLTDWRLFSSVASVSAGIELMHNAILVMGNRANSPGDLVIAHAVMQDAIDTAAIHQAMQIAADPSRIVNVFAKAEPSPDGQVRGARHTMLDDTDISATRHARAAVGGLLAGLVGATSLYVSGGAEHQGPPGGGPVAVIARA